MLVALDGLVVTVSSNCWSDHEDARGSGAGEPLHDGSGRLGVAAEMEIADAERQQQEAGPP